MSVRTRIWLLPIVPSKSPAIGNRSLAPVAFVLAEVAVNGAVVECDLVVFMQVGAHLFGNYEIGRASCRERV